LRRVNVKKKFSLTFQFGSESHVKKWTWLFSLGGAFFQFRKSTNFFSFLQTAKQFLKIEITPKPSQTQLFQACGRGL
jgi:hypothetical protein